MDGDNWHAPPTDLTLLSGELQVWRIPLNQPDTVVERLKKTLETNEIERAGMFYFDRDKKRYLIACGAKREILAGYLKCTPGEIRFTFGKYGKPQLKTEINQPEFSFNLAHSNEWALLAVTRQDVVGIDIEFTGRNLSELDQLIGIFSNYERETLRSLSGKFRLKGFYNCWTRKEAYVKAIGMGLSYPLQDFDVTCRPGAEAKLLRVRGQPQVAEHWELIELDLGCEFYVAAVAAELPRKKLTLYNWCIQAI